MTKLQYQVLIVLGVGCDAGYVYGLVRYDFSSVNTLFLTNTCLSNHNSSQPKVSMKINGNLHFSQISHGEIF